MSAPMPSSRACGRGMLPIGSVGISTATMILMLEFRRLQRDELPLLHEWLARPHVARWWNDGDRTLDEVVAHYLPALDGTDPTDHFMVVLDGRPIGFIETYMIADHADWEAVVHAGPGVAGVDLFIAEPELTGKGL